MELKFVVVFLVIKLVEVKRSWWAFVTSKVSMPQKSARPMTTANMRTLKDQWIVDRNTHDGFKGFSSDMFQVPGMCTEKRGLSKGKSCFFSLSV